MTHDDRTTPHSGIGATGRDAEFDTQVIGATGIPVVPRATRGRRITRTVVTTLAASVVAATVGGFLGSRTGGQEPASGGLSPTSAPVTNIEESTTQSTSSTAVPPTTTEPPSIGTEPPGLFCADLSAKGYTYDQAVEYWIREGKPSRMDASRNGVPCQTVYPSSQVKARWGSDMNGDCPTANDLESAFDRNPDLAAAIVLGSGFSDIVCIGTWATALTNPAGYDRASVLFRIIDGEPVAVDGGTAGFFCEEHGIAPSDPASQLCY